MQLLNVQRYNELNKLRLILKAIRTQLIQNMQHTLNTDRIYNTWCEDESIGYRSFEVIQVSHIRLLGYISAIKNEREPYYHWFPTYRQTLSQESVINICVQLVYQLSSLILKVVRS